MGGVKGRVEEKGGEGESSGAQKNGENEGEEGIEGRR